MPSGAGRAGHLSNIYARGGGPRPNRSAQRRGPLRKIVRPLTRTSGSMFDVPLVELECGHTEYSRGAFRARCGTCARLSIPAREGTEPTEGGHPNG
jgi:hypothetical protein